MIVNQILSIDIDYAIIDRFYYIKLSKETVEILPDKESSKILIVDCSKKQARIATRTSSFCKEKKIRLVLYPSVLVLLSFTMTLFCIIDYRDEDQQETKK